MRCACQKNERERETNYTTTGATTITKNKKNKNDDPIRRLMTDKRNSRITCRIVCCVVCVCCCLVLLLLLRWGWWGVSVLFFSSCCCFADTTLAYDSRLINQCGEDDHPRQNRIKSCDSIFLLKKSGHTVIIIFSMGYYFI